MFLATGMLAFVFCLLQLLSCCLTFDAVDFVLSLADFSSTDASFILRFNLI